MVETVASVPSCLPACLPASVYSAVVDNAIKHATTSLAEMRALRAQGGYERRAHYKVQLASPHAATATSHRPLLNHTTASRHSLLNSSLPLTHSTHARNIVHFLSPSPLRSIQVRDTSALSRCIHHVSATNASVTTAASAIATVAVAVHARLASRQLSVAELQPHQRRADGIHGPHIQPRQSVMQRHSHVQHSPDSSAPCICISSHCSS